MVVASQLDYTLRCDKPKAVALVIYWIVTTPTTFQSGFQWGVTIPLPVLDILNTLYRMCGGIRVWGVSATCSDTK
jgi:hypothetical protein